MTERRTVLGGKFQMSVSEQRVIRSTPCTVFGAADRIAYFVSNFVAMATRVG